jgi:hypothetical protein
METDPARRRALEALPRLNTLDRQIEELGKQILDADGQGRVSLEAQLLEVKAARSDLMREAGISEFEETFELGERYVLPGPSPILDLAPLQPGAMRFLIGHPEREFAGDWAELLDGLRGLLRCEVGGGRVHPGGHPVMIFVDVRGTQLGPDGVRAAILSELARLGQGDVTVQLET